MKKTVKILVSISSSAWGAPPIGSNVEMDLSEANSLIAAGYASEVEEEKREPRRNAMKSTRGRRKAITE